MKLYHYKKGTNEFLRSRDAQLDPRETKRQGKNVYLIPPFATAVEPPSEAAGRARVFADGAWSQVEDNRGLTVYSKGTGEPSTVVDLGPLSDAVTTNPPPDQYSKYDGTGWVPDFEKCLARDRGIRDYLLVESDFSQLVDVPLADEKKEEWRVYRQALRDYTEGYYIGKPFPTVPED